jgi:hypothetical protein
MFFKDSGIKNILGGFSLVKLITVSSIFTILLITFLFYGSCSEKLTRPDEQAQKIIDVFREARRSSSAEGETMRVEIDLMDNLVRLIDENQPQTADDDRLVKNIALLPLKEVKINTRPQNIATTPTEIMPVPVAQFRQSKYPASFSHNVFTFRFLPNGTITNEGTDAVGSNATTVGLTLFVWSPRFTNGNESEIARAITVIGGTGSIRFWEYKPNLPETEKWKESGRISFYNRKPDD